VVGQFTAGTIGAWMGGMILYRAVDDPYSPGRRTKGDAGYQRSANVAFAIGSWFGSTAGVLAATGLGCRAPGPVAIGTAIPSAVLLAGYDEPYLPLFGLVFGAPLQAIGGTIAAGATAQR
jgi:hypothetical protein